MASDTLRMDAEKVYEKATMKIIIHKSLPFAIKERVALWLFGVAGRLMGCKVEIELTHG